MHAKVIDIHSTIKHVVSLYAIRFDVIVFCQLFEALPYEKKMEWDML